MSSDSLSLAKNKIQKPEGDIPGGGRELAG